jgi:hypothetical protein
MKIGSKEYELSRRKSEYLAMITMGCGRALASRQTGVSHSEVESFLANDSDFASDLEKAESALEQFCLMRIRNSMGSHSNWRAGAWLLERLLPEKYGFLKAESVSEEVLHRFLEQITQILNEELKGLKRHERVLERIEALKRKKA